MRTILAVVLLAACGPSERERAAEICLLEKEAYEASFSRVDTKSDVKAASAAYQASRVDLAARMLVEAPSFFRRFCVAEHARAPSERQPPKTRLELERQLCEAKTADEYRVISAKLEDEWAERLKKYEADVAAYKVRVDAGDYSAKYPESPAR